MRFGLYSSLSLFTAAIGVQVSNEDLKLFAQTMGLSEDFTDE